MLMLFFCSSVILFAQTGSKVRVVAAKDIVNQEVVASQSKAPGDLSDGFEAYPDFNLSFSPWTTVDLDQKTTYGIQDITFPNSGQPMAFIVFNPSATTPPITNSAILPHGGSKFAACFASTEGANNDWLISPQVTLGTNSSVSMWVKSYTDQYGLERYKVGVSTSNTNPSSFTIISGSNYLTAPATAWEQKTFNLDAYNGQNVYIGIQCVSNDAFIFMVDDFSVTTTPAANLPVVTTTAASSITATTAVSGGNVSSDGGAAVTARGVVWSTSQNPTITSNLGMTNNGTGTGSFVSNLSNLTANTTYYVRAYATNSSGTGYGSQLSFTTLQAGGGDDWTATTITLYGTAEGALMHRTGDVDNLGFGWPNGFDPFTGQSTPSHGFPFFPEADDPDGTDRIMVISGFQYGSNSKDGYTSSTSRPGNLPRPIVLNYNLQSIAIQTVTIQMFVDDFQAGVFGPNQYLVTIDGIRIPLLESILNSLNQTGPIGKMITAQLPTSFNYLFADGTASILIDDPVHNVADGFAVDFVKILINATNFQNTGTISGIVTNESGSPLAGATVTAGGVVTTTTNASGAYTLSAVPAGLVYVTASKSGYSSVSHLVELVAGGTSTRNFSLPSSTGTGTLAGLVTDAVNGNPIAGALVSIAGITATTNASGNYSISDIPLGELTAAFNASNTSGQAPLQVQFFDQSSDGSHTLSCSKEGYLTYSNNNVVVPQGQTLTMNISLSPALTEGALRFVINWGATPTDLDSHLQTPQIEGQAYHIYYSSTGSISTAPYAALDHDVTSGYGPETMTIYQMFPGTYKYYIYNYSNSPSITTSNAVVQIYNQNGLLNTLQVPTTGEGLYWYVCDVNGNNGQISIVNTIQNAPPGNKNDAMPPKKTNAKNVTSWTWSFGDGTGSTEQHPVKTYTSGGTYTVSLTVGNGTSSATETKMNYITVEGGTAVLNGMVTDAATGNPIEGAMVSIAGLSAQTNASGNYVIENIPLGALMAGFNVSASQGTVPFSVQFFDQSSDGANRVVCSKSGYITYVNNNIVIEQGQSLNLNISLSQTLAEGNLRFVLNWGELPYDLDSHLRTPSIEGSSYHVYYSAQGSATSAPYAALDHDDTDSYGPETVTIYTMYPGTYKYYIYNYSNTPDITTSGAVVQIYNQNGLLNTLQVPTTGSGYYWYICDVDGSSGQITIKNVIQNSPPDGNKDAMPPKQNRNVTSWHWDFGDGTSSNQQNPVKLYETPGVYSVSLTVGNGTTTDIETKTDFIIATNAASIRDGLVAYLPFNGDAQDASGRNHHGSVSGAALDDDRFGSSAHAYAFDGVNDYIEVPYHADFDITNQLTVSCWFRHDDDPTCYEDILMKGGDAWGLQLSCDGSGEILFHLFTSSHQNLSSGIRPMAGNWYHITGVYDGSQQKIYINGVLKNSISLSGAIHTNSDPFTVGYKVAGDNAYLKGIVDEVRVYNRAFSPSEVPSLVRDAAGINDLYAQNLVVYPNPVRDFATLINCESGMANIYDLNGRLVHSVRIESSQLNVSSIERGIYVLKVVTGTHSYTTKLVKE